MITLVIHTVICRFKDGSSSILISWTLEGCRHGDIDSNAHLHPRYAWDPSSHVDDETLDDLLLSLADV